MKIFCRGFSNEWKFFFFNLGSFDPLNSRKLIGCMIDVLLFRYKKRLYGMDDFINKMEMRYFFWEKIY